MAEFALTLPILLILVFGIIEFGRVFQAWVTLQNSARAAARYASTGGWDEVRLPLNDRGEDDPDSVVPCVGGSTAGENEDLRGSQRTIDPNGNGTIMVNIYEGGAESLFATWWDGRNCHPGIVQHQDMRKDIVRIVSIVHEAYRGAAGLSTGPSPLDQMAADGEVTEPEVRNFLYDVWYRPLPGGGVNNHREGYDQSGWFDVMLCSSRPVVDDFSERYYGLFPSRFAGVLDASDIRHDIPGNPPADIAARAPVCLMNEHPNPDNTNPEVIKNPGIPWWDAGSAGDSVTVVITFNHPLITPLGLAEYIPLQARRVAVNEAFRVADATRALPGAGPAGGINRPPIARASSNSPRIDTDQNGTEPVQLFPRNDQGDSYDPEDGTNLRYEWFVGETLRSTEASPTIVLEHGIYNVTLRVYDTLGAMGETRITVEVRAPAPTHTPEPTDTPEPSATPAPPFSCDLISVGQVSFAGNRVYVQIQNQNVDSTTLTQADLHWRLIGEFPSMHVAAFALDNLIHWAGQDYTPPTNTNADPPTPPDLFMNADRTVHGESVMTWEAVFAGGPPVLHDPFANPPIMYMTQYDLGGTSFTFDNPNGAPCRIPLDLPEPTPSPTIDPDRPTNTPTYTPDCASDQISVRFIEFQSFGVVRLEVTNRRPVVGEFINFRVNWVQRAPGIMTLERVTVGGQGPADTFTPTVRVWQSGSISEDANPATTGRSEGQWLTNYTFPPNSTTPLYLDFGGTTTTIQTSFNVAPSDFNGTWFEITCDTTGGGGGGGGGGNSGIINLFEENTPAPTPTRGPSNTPRPTYTPSRTFTPGAPTNTPRPQPSPTQGPSNTPKPTNTVAFPTRTPSSGGGTEG